MNGEGEVPKGLKVEILDRIIFCFRKGQAQFHRLMKATSIVS